jgi:cyanophycin synthetase
VRESGTAVLNAEDPRVAALAPSLKSKVLLFAVDPNAPALRAHLEDGGLAITLEGEDITLRGASGKTALANVRDVPITLDGKARFNVENALAAAAACHALGVPDATIRRGLETFNPTIGQLPGRMNLLEVERYHVLIDYGHNPSALRALAAVLPEIAKGGRILNVASASGNRRDDDIREFGRALSGMYDEVYLCDPDPRGRDPGETTRLIEEGLRAGGLAAERVRVLLDENDAINAALEAARDGDLVVLQVDNVRRAIARVRARQGKPPAPAPGRAEPGQAAVGDARSATPVPR